jgi:Na+-transporting methylmalonyl-CoA/oxaloacetate decarboxylase gamma subunit
METNFDSILQEGLTISLVGVIIVFIALLVLYRVFTWISMLIGMNIRQKLRRQGKSTEAGDDSMMIPGDHSAAIAMALYMYNELHDEESNILTIDRVSRVYSPWSSKYYNMRHPVR